MRAVIHFQHAERKTPNEIHTVCKQVMSTQAAHLMNTREAGKRCRDVPAEIGIVLDSSVSIWTKDFELGKKFLQDLVSYFDIGTHKTRFSLILFGRGVYTDDAFDLNTFSDKDALLEALKNVKHQKGNYTATGKGIDYMVQHQLSADKVRAGIPRIGVVITDGNSQEGKKTEDAAAAAVADGIEMIAIGVGTKIKEQELVNIAGGNASRVIRADDFSELEKLLTPLTEHICEPLVADEPVCSDVPLDVYFVFSQSALGLVNTAWTVDFISNFISSDDFESSYRYGTITDTCDSGFEIGTYHDTDRIKNRIRGYETYKLPGLVDHLVAKGFPDVCGQSRGNIAVIFSTSGQKASVALESHVADLVAQGVKVYLVDISGENVQIDGAVTLVGQSAVAVAGELATKICSHSA